MTAAIAAVAVLLSVAATSSAVAGPSFTATPILKAQFAGTFANNVYQPADGEKAAGTLTKTGNTSVANGLVTVNGGSDGLSFSPSVSLGSGSQVTSSVALEAVVQRTANASLHIDTVLALAGGVNYRYGGSNWRYDMYGINNSVFVQNAAAAPSSKNLQHIGLVYTYINSTSTQLNLFIDGCSAGSTLTNASAAQLAANALGFGREAHPYAEPRGFHGTIDAIAAETFTGPFPGASGFQLPEGQTCNTAPVTPGNMVPVGAHNAEAAAAAVRPTPRQLSWQQMETTAFFHFNMSTFTNADDSTGREAPSVFNPSAVNTDQWAATLKANGYKMAILTVKHADGFLLYPSVYSDHSVASSPYQNGAGDIVRQFVNSMRAQGIKVGFYFSPLNRHEMNVVHSDWNPNYPRWGYSAAKGNRSCTVPAVPVTGKPSFTFTTDEYNCLYTRELYEIFSNYGQIDEWWIDGNATSRRPISNDNFRAWSSAGGADPNQRYDNNLWYQVAHALQPSMLYFNAWDIRWVGTETGFGRTGGEWSPVAISNQPTDPLPKVNGGGTVGDRSTWSDATYMTWNPAEVDVSIMGTPDNNSWFKHSWSVTKTPAHLWHVYAASVGRNANLLLNFGPDQAGVIPADQVSTAEALKANIDRVFGTDRSGGCPVTASNNGYTFTCNFTSSQTVNWVTLQEDIANYGQRIDAFTLEAYDPASGTWRPQTVNSWDKNGNVIADSTERIGYKRLLHLTNPVTTTALRITVTNSRQVPHLLEFQAHRD